MHRCHPPSRVCILSPPADFSPFHLLLWDNRDSSGGSPALVQPRHGVRSTACVGARPGLASSMKPLRLVSTPTRNRRLNEILGLVVLVSAGLLLLALATYAPTDPSADTVGGYAASAHAQTGLGARLGAEIHGPAHNWTGLAGAWIADAILQTIGIAAFFLP